LVAGEGLEPRPQGLVTEYRPDFYALARQKVISKKKRIKKEIGYFNILCFTYRHDEKTNTKYCYCL